jgi:hypothetical protein
VVQWECNEFADKSWSLEPGIAPNSYTIHNLFTGYCIGLGGYDYDGVHYGEQLVQWYCNDAPDKYWILERDAAAYKLHPGIDTDYCVYVDDYEGAQPFLTNCNDPSYSPLDWLVEPIQNVSAPLLERRVQ